MSTKPLREVAAQRPSFMELLHLLPPYTVEDVISAYKERSKQIEQVEESDPQTVQ